MIRGRRATGETCTATDTLRATANPGGVQGDATGFWVAGLFYLKALPATDQWLCSNGFVSATSGWALEIRPAGASGVNLRIAGGGASYRSPQRALEQDDVGRLHLAIGVYDGAGNCVLYFDKEAAATTAGTAFANGAHRTVIGGSTQFATSFRLRDAVSLGMAGGHAVPSADQAAAYFDDVKRAGRLVPMTGVTTGRIYRTDGAANVFDEITDTDPVSMVSGTPVSTVSVRRASWGW